MRIRSFLPVLMASQLGLINAQDRSCLSNPRQAECADATLTEENMSQSLDMLCQSMDNMQGCSVRKACAEDKNAFPSPYCQPMSILGDICAMDMPRMRGCGDYTQLCGVDTSVSDGTTPSSTSSMFPNTAVKACSEEAPLPSLPSTWDMSAEIHSICTEMDMADCAKCPLGAEPSMLNCDVLSVYSSLCISMPGMYQCASWSKMCAQSAWKNSVYCVDNNIRTSPPVMKMFYHTSPNVYVLFEWAVPRSEFQYWLAFAVCFLSAFLYEALIAYQAILEVRWARKNKASWCYPARLSPAQTEKPPSPSTSCCDSKQALPSPNGQAGPSIAIKRGLFKFVTATIGYAIMLVTMTFNVGLYFAVVGGLAVGTMVFGGFMRRANLEGGVDEHSLSGTACC